MANNIDLSKMSLIYVYSGTPDPSVTAYDAEKGTVYIRTGNGATGFYQKQDNGLTTNWVLVANGAPGPQGPIGLTGPMGGPGANGAVWRTGTGVPSNGLGADGDYYLDNSTGNVYQRMT